MTAKKIKIFGKEIIDSAAIDQLRRCVGKDDYGVLTPDAHVGYSHPIGGAIAYRDRISLSGVGFDIACGNMAVKTALKSQDLKDLSRVMDEICNQISFGMGRSNSEKVDHPVLDKISRFDIQTSRSHKQKLVQLARDQLGTVGAGNHYVDLFKDEEEFLWIGVHFGSRGFGHKITTGFIAISQGGRFEDRAREGTMFGDPILFDPSSEVGQDYLQMLELAGEYAYAGREWVIDKVLSILGNPKVNFTVHNHHNYAWQEEHFGEDFWVVRKGCTPAFPGQQGFIGANMFDTSVIVEGIDSAESKEGLYSTVHGAGRVMSRRKALGKTKWKRDRNGVKRWTLIKKGEIDYENTLAKAENLKIELRGGGADESPECYKDLNRVLGYQSKTVKVLHRLKPIGVAMAGTDVYDPYKD